jgi:hypothetical protein
VTLPPLAQDAVSIRRVRVRGMTDSALRKQFAGIATPRVRRWVFIRRLEVRASALELSDLLQKKLRRLADEPSPERIEYADFGALVVACARAALSGELTSGWHWRTLGLPSGGPGPAVGTLLVAHPLEAGAAVAALARHGVLAPVWRDLPEELAAELITALAAATGVSAPMWPATAHDQHVAAPLPAIAVARAAEFWAPILRGLAPRAEAVRAAALLSMLRWAPSALGVGNKYFAPQLLDRLTAIEVLPQPARRSKPEDTPPAALPPKTTSAPDGPSSPERAAPEIPAVPPPLRDATAEHDQESIVTDYGGVLFLINALKRLSLGVQLAALGSAAPSGWRVLAELAAALGVPEDEPIARFLAANDPETEMPPGWVAELLAGLETLYRSAGPWPLPLQQSARLEVSETHLDLYLHVRTIDLALRIAGLDLDPGWVPWLGRVVLFHYDELTTQWTGGG